MTSQQLIEGATQASSELLREATQLQRAALDAEENTRTVELSPRDAKRLAEQLRQYAKTVRVLAGQLQAAYEHHLLRGVR